MRLLSWVAVAAISIAAGLPGSAGAIILTIDQNFAVPGVVAEADGVAVIRSGANAGIYIPTNDSNLVTVLDEETGAFEYQFSIDFPTLLDTEFRAIDVLPNGNLIIGQHDLNLVREVVIPANPGNATIPAATYGPISFGPFTHTDGQAFDEFESISAFENPANGQLYLLIGEEGRNLPGATVESPGEVYLATMGAMTPSTFTKLFDVPFDDGSDDISGLDTINIVFDGAGNIDFANSTILMTDDSSADSTGVPKSGAFVLNLLGMVLETLDGPGEGTVESYETLFGETWRDAEGADYNEETGEITIFFSTAGGLPPVLVRFDSVLEAPPAPEPATFSLIGLGLGAVALLRRRS